jgi:hypothetical protein
MPVGHLSTHDEHIASEAAFRGLPLNPNWSDAAKRIYQGVRAVLEKSNRPQSISETQETEQIEEGTKDPGMPLHDALPFYVPSVQAWHVQFTDRAEKHLILINSSIPVDTVLHAIQVDDPNRPFVMRPLQIADLRLAPSTVTPTSPETRLIRSDGYVIPHYPQH